MKLGLLLRGMIANNNADHWWEKINEINSNKDDNIQLTAPEDRAWGIRDFTLLDPSGVMWRIGNRLRLLKVKFQVHSLFGYNSGDKIGHAEFL
ncbi:VOC family protein [Parapedobacter koreensis]|uniref:Uncharacterized protein n=1 Tax=Parapedobacter koreensis TaxID=332977 RepID=A0A1H7EUQ4_9SPHI|nr:hypothetical protein [Parapedobacter koreensis]SEK17633.1 hypothetical protein SAMN05421740_10110 [Parapedobacter koreensis]